MWVVTVTTAIQCLGFYLLFLEGYYCGEQLSLSLDSLVDDDGGGTHSTLALTKHDTDNDYLATATRSLLFGNMLNSATTSNRFQLEDASFNTSVSVMSVNFGYYESWAIYRPADCNRVRPRDINVAGNHYTHLSYAFAGIDIQDKLSPWAGDNTTEVPLYREFNTLKTKYPGLQTLISVGGWTFTDPGTATRTLFSDIAANSTRTAVFAKSVVNFLQAYAFDGIDFDWEYPGEPSRGGTAADLVNFPKLLQAVRHELDAAPNNYILTMAIPASEYSLNQGYNLSELAKSVDWMNLMAYDFHGGWDSPKILGAHTDIRQIRKAVKYIRERGLPSNQLVLGMANYGHIYTLANRSCTTVGCPFVTVGPGGCSGGTGTMPFFSIRRLYLAPFSYQSLTLNPDTKSMELVNGSTWISYDSKRTWRSKKQYAASMSLRGIMRWAVDQVTPSAVPVDFGSPTAQPSSAGETTPSPSTDRGSTTPMQTKFPYTSNPGHGPSSGKGFTATPSSPISPRTAPTNPQGSPTGILSPTISPTTAPNLQSSSIQSGSLSSGSLRHGFIDAPWHIGVCYTVVVLLLVVYKC